MGDPNSQVSQPGTSRKKRQILNQETRELALHVLEKCIEEKNAGIFFHPVSQPLERAVYYSGISKQTLNVISKVADSEPLVVPCSKKPKNPKNLCPQVSDFDRSVIYECLQEIMYFSKGNTSFSAPEILGALQERIYFPWGIMCFRRLLNNMGYQWQRNGGRHHLIEQPAKVRARSKYLKNIRQYRQEGRYVFFLLETYFDNNVKMSPWKNNSEEPFNIDTTPKLIFVLSGKNSSFLNGANLLSKASKPVEDNEPYVKKDTIEGWVTSVVLPNLPTNSVIIMDSATHIVQKCRIPHKSSPKKDFLKWLDQHSIKFMPIMTKDDLYKLITLVRPNFEVDSIIRKNGHEVMTLPEFMFDLNPIEKMWAKIKRVIAKHKARSDLSKQGFEYIAESAIAKVRQIVEKNCQVSVNNVVVKEETEENTIEEVNNVVLEEETEENTIDKVNNVVVKEEIEENTIDEVNNVVVKEKIQENTIDEVNNVVVKEERRGTSVRFEPKSDPLYLGPESFIKTEKESRKEDDSNILAPSEESECDSD